MEILLTLGVMICIILWVMYRREWAIQKEEAQKWLAETILTEAEGAVLDFLDYGREVSLATRGKYRGVISVRMHPVYKTGEMGFCVSMYDSGDLSQIREEVLARLHLEAFVKKYGYYYDPERDAIRFQTSRGVKLKAGEREELERRLIRRIQNHPLAVIKSDTVIGTRGI